MAEAAVVDEDLRASLDGLARLVTGHGRQGLEDMLRHVAEFAVHAIPGADGAGLTLHDQDRSDTVVSSAEFVRQVHAIQYGIGEGPCITAAADARTVRSGRLDTDPQWPRFGPRVARLGVHSALSLPLLDPDRVVVGALNVYAHAYDAFDDRATTFGELFAIPAAVTVRNAHTLTQARILAAQLQAGLTSRAGIDQAIGIIMSRSGCTAAEAFDKLRTISQTENRKLAAVAQQIIDDAVHRAQTRRPR